MKNRVLIVGMQPSAVPENVKVRRNSTFHRLNKWMDKVNIKYYSFINTIENAFDKAESKSVDNVRLKLASYNYNKVIALGGFASESLEKAGIKHFKLPHPSPRNRLLNDKKYEEQILNQFSAYLRKDS